MVLEKTLNPLAQEAPDEWLSQVPPGSLVEQGVESGTLAGAHGGVSRCWQWVPQDQKELYKKQVEGLQTQYKVDLDPCSGLCLLKNMLLTER